MIALEYLIAVIFYQNIDHLLGIFEIITFIINGLLHEQLFSVIFSRVSPKSNDDRER